MWRSMKNGVRSALIALSFTVLMPAGNVYASNPAVTGGAAAIGRQDDGSIQVSAPKNEDSSMISVPMPQRDVDMSNSILKGVYMDDLDLSGLNYEQAAIKVRGHVNDLLAGNITVECVDGASETFDVNDFGMSWSDYETIADLTEMGNSGSIVGRYKLRKDLEHEKYTVPLKINIDEEAISEKVSALAHKYNHEPIKGTLTREDGEFVILPGTSGTVLDEKASVKTIMSKLGDYRGGDMTISLPVIQKEPDGTSEELSKIHDLLGTFTTSFSTSSSDRSGNVRTGTEHINGTLLYPGEQFSTYSKVSPFTEENGYYLAGSYLNGMVVESLGGGICQVSSTLYNAVLRAELQIDERYNHSMIVNYVKMSSDAAISGTSKDFKFTNNLDNPIYIEGYTTDDKQVVFNIYGVETRPSNRTLEFESVEISKTEPTEEKIVTDSSLPFGSISVQSMHTGYSGEFWKIVKVDGEEVDRIRINKSYYQPTPQTATVGTATDNPAALAALQTAIATGSIDYVKSTIASLNAAAAAASVGGQ